MNILNYVDKLLYKSSNKQSRILHSFIFLLEYLFKRKKIGKEKKEKEE